MIIDFHSHILPGIDDGSRNRDITEQMLEASASQGVGLMLATPHFYASRDRMDHFLEKRERAWECIRDLREKYPIQIRKGAEVAFFRGISRAERLDELTIEGTRVLLLEMPFEPWEPSDVDEVEDLIDKRGYGILLAHMERYLDLPGNKTLVEELLSLPLSVQINAQSLTVWRGRGRLVKMFRNGRAHVLGSDTHGIHRRPPNLGDGRAVLAKRLGEAFLAQMDAYGGKLLGI